MSIDAAIKEVEGAGWSWALCREADGTYTAVVNRLSLFLLDDLKGPTKAKGKTPDEALLTAFATELKYEAKHLEEERLAPEKGWPPSRDVSS